MILLVTSAFGATVATSFTTDAGGWTGGALTDGVLAATDGEVAFEAGPLAVFTLDLRLRLASGSRLTVSVGDAELVASYGEGGGLALGATTAPLPLGDQAWSGSGDLLDGAAPDAVGFDGAWRLFRVTDGTIVMATSSDAVAWVEQGAVVDGDDPVAVDEGGVLALYYTCPDESSVCRAESLDGVSFVEDGVVLADASAPSVAARPEGGWRMWAARDGGVFTATSEDGLSWTEEGTAASALRLYDLDASAFAGGTAGVWLAADGVRSSRGGPDDDLASASGDALLLPTGFAAWCPDLPGSAALAADGTTWHLWVEAEGTIGHLRGTPEPGAWVGLTLAWDGSTLSASWDDAIVFSTPLASADRFVVGAEGTLELDEAVLVYTAAGGGDTGAPDDTADTGDTADTAAPDSGDTADTADSGDTADTADTAEATPDTADTGDTAIAWRTAAELAGEAGGCSCNHGGATSTLPFGLMALLVPLARRRNR